MNPPAGDTGSRQLCDTEVSISLPVTQGREPSQELPAGLGGHGGVSFPVELSPCGAGGPEDTLQADLGCSPAPCSPPALTTTLPSCLVGGPIISVHPAAMGQSTASSTHSCR